VSLLRHLLVLNQALLPLVLLEVALSVVHQCAQGFDSVHRVEQPPQVEVEEEVQSQDHLQAAKNVEPLFLLALVSVPVVANNANPLYPYL